jgi:tetratricopeptide (TPR) repeat protein
MMIPRTIVLATALLIAMQCMAMAESIEKAEMLRDYGLIAEAKTELINIIFSNAPDTTVAAAYYDLGAIAFDEGNVSVALDTWTQLVNKFPASEQALLVKDRINALAGVMGEVSNQVAGNAVAQLYLSNADFWSKDKSSVYIIDASWIPKEDAACFWYDKVILEFPNSVASNLAYQGKLMTLIGWKEPGQYGDSYGVTGDFDKYMPQLLRTFSSYEAAFPDDPSLQAFRYQIAQIYWTHRDWDKTKEWLTLIIEKSGATDSFYRDLAERRLQKIEY